ncbi:MAG: hypothetical protein HYY18_20260 [Planctomycetes bacterium]|nr:hypothetical protein [Planctomycetota bacterium]
MSLARGFAMQGIDPERWQGRPEAPPPRRRRLFYRILTGTGVFVVASVLIAKWWIVPLAVRNHISGWLASHSYARLEIRSASVGWKTIVLRKLRLTDREGRLLGEADEVRIRLDRPLVGFGKPAVSSMRVIRPDVSAVLNDEGRLDIERALRRPPEAPPPSPNPLKLPETIQVEDGQIRFSAPYVATVFGKVNADLHVSRQRFTFTTVQAQGFGGRASLSGFVGREKGEGWAMQINVAGGNVREMTRGTTLEGKHLEGRLDGFLSLEGDRSGGGKAVGAGWIDVADGRLTELPVLLSVLNVLRLKLPGDALVNACRTDFRVLDDRLRFDRFYVLTEGICLAGDGDVLFKAHEVDLTFILRLIGELPLGIETVREAARPATDFFTRNFLLAVEVKGTWSDPSARPLPIRIVSKLLMDVVDELIRGARE